MKTRIEDLNSYLVGGAVRSLLMGKTPADMDYVVVGSCREEMLSLGFKEISAKSFPVFHHPITGEEWALARKERLKADGEFEFDVSTVTLGEDLARRDFTMNAMAHDKGGTIIDPFGGRWDIDKGVIRHIGDYAFMEDPLRILRAARFAAECDMSVSYETTKLIREMCANGHLVNVVKERIWAETKKALNRSNNPSIYFKCLDDFHALGVLFPEIKLLQELPECSAHHGEGSTFDHIMLALDAASTITDDVKVLWAVICHDLGKLKTPKEERPKYHNHGKLGKDVVIALCGRLGTERNVKTFATLSARHHMKYHSITKMKPSTIVKLLNELGVRHGLGKLKDFITVCRADCMGRKNQKPLDEQYRAQRGQVLLYVMAMIMRSMKIRLGLESADAIKQCWMQDVVNEYKKIKPEIMVK